jgi:XTP/dITP diphosphohydrolase
LKILIASANPEKRAELEKLLEGLPVEVVSLADYPDAPEVEENGRTFEENAAKKAIEMALYSGLHTVADDSGLCVDVLGGAPGIMSARYAGPGATYRDMCKKLLKEMRYVPDSERTAHFECHIAFCDPEGNVLITAKGECAGTVTRHMRGGKGFGYDPVFLYTPAGKTFAQMLPEEKNKLSHRARAMREFRQKLEELLTEVKIEEKPPKRTRSISARDDGEEDT